MTSHPVCPCVAMEQFWAGSLLDISDNRMFHMTVGYIEYRFLQFRTEEAMDLRDERPKNLHIISYNPYITFGNERSKNLEGDQTNVPFCYINSQIRFLHYWQCLLATLLIFYF